MPEQAIKTVETCDHHLRGVCWKGEGGLPVTVKRSGWNKKTRLRGNPSLLGKDGL